MAGNVLDMGHHGVARWCGQMVWPGRDGDDLGITPLPGRPREVIIVHSVCAYVAHMPLRSRCVSCQHGLSSKEDAMLQTPLPAAVCTPETFRTFVTGAPNAVAYNAALSV